VSGVTRQVAVIVARYKDAGRRFPRLSVAEFSTIQCKCHADALAIEVVETQDKLTYPELWTRICRVADALDAHGVGPGDRVAIQIPNGWEYLVFWLALAQIGAVHVPVNTRYLAEETAYVLKDSGAKLAIVAEPLAATMRQAAALAETAITVEVATDFFASLGRYRPRTRHHPQPDDLLNIQYTSGTTGMPKGCVLSHNYWLVLTRAAALMIAPGLSSSRFLGWLVDHDIDWCMFPILMARPSRTGRKGKTVLKTGCDLWLVRRDLCPFPFGFRGAGARRFRHDRNRPWHHDTARVGRYAHHGQHRSRGAVPGNERAPGRRHPADAGEPGELWVRGRWIFQDYWNQPKPTAEACPGEGWFRIGDVFVKDEDRFHWITGRIKDMSRRSSDNIAAREVEVALCTLPEIVEAAALAQPDDIQGEEVLAVVQHMQHCPDEKEVEKFAATAAEMLKTRLASFKLSRYWIFVPDYPRTASNKVQKEQLRAQTADESAFDLVGQSYRGSGWTERPTDTARERENVYAKTA